MSPQWHRLARVACWILIWFAVLWAIPVVADLYGGTRQGSAFGAFVWTFFVLVMFAVVESE